LNRLGDNKPSSQYPKPHQNEQQLDYRVISLKICSDISNYIKLSLIYTVNPMFKPLVECLMTRPGYNDGKQGNGWRAHSHRYRTLPIVLIITLVLTASPALVLGALHAPLSQQVKANPVGAASPRHQVADGPPGVVDYGNTYPFNTSQVLGNAVINTLTTPSGDTFLIQLVGVLNTGGDHYYLVEEYLALNQTQNAGYAYTLADTLLNLSAYPSHLSSHYISGLGGLRNTPNGVAYTYTYTASGRLTTPFEYTPSIKVQSTLEGTQVDFQATLTEMSPQLTLFQSELDTVIISEPHQSTPTITVGGHNPVNQNVLEIVLNTPTQGTQPTNVEGYLQLFYGDQRGFAPVPEAQSSGADVAGSLPGLHVYPLYNQTAPVALVSSQLTGFTTLWPLNHTTILLTAQRGLTLGINTTSVNLSRGAYQIPQYTGEGFIENTIRLTPEGGAQEVTLSAPGVIQPEVGYRGVFLGWNHTLKAGTLKFNLTRQYTVSEAYQPQYLLTEIYLAQPNQTPIGKNYEWVNAGANTTVRLPTMIYEGSYVRFLFVGATLNQTQINASEFEVKLVEPTTLYAYYAKQFLIAFVGSHREYYSRLDEWANASQQVNISLPLYIRDGQYARLAFQSYTLGNQTETNLELQLTVTAPVNVTLNYTQQYQLNFTGAYSQYYYAYSAWYNQGENYSVTIPQTLMVNTTFRIVYDNATINKNTTTTQAHFTGTASTPIIIQLTLTPQYLVVINAPNTHIHAFYNRSQTISVQAPYYSGNIFKLDVFREWVGTLNTTSTQLTLNVNGPIHETAVYTRTYIRLLLIMVSIGAILAATLTIYLKSRTSRPI